MPGFLHLVADGDTRKVIEVFQLCWNIEVAQVYILRVKVLHPADYIDNLRDQVCLFLLDSCQSIILVIKLQSTLLQNKNRKVSNLPMHYVNGVHLVCEILFINLDIP